MEKSACAEKAAFMGGKIPCLYAERKKTKRIRKIYGSIQGKPDNRYGCVSIILLHFCIAPLFIHVSPFLKPVLFQRFRSVPKTNKIQARPLQQVFTGMPVFT